MVASMKVSMSLVGMEELAAVSDWLLGGVETEVSETGIREK